jgi:hypothetical protein
MEEVADVLIRETVLDVQALLLGVDEVCGPKDLKVLRCVCDADRCLIGKGLYGAWRLAEQVE